MPENRNHWLADFRGRLGVPDSRRVQFARACCAWWQTEGGATSAEFVPSLDPGQETDFNPFNTTRVMPGSHNQPGNSVPVQVYSSRESGMLATILTIRQANFSRILKRMFAEGVSAHGICVAIKESEWGTGDLIFRVLEDITDRGLYWRYAGIPVYGE
jgi:hypothetical protein